MQTKPPPYYRGDIINDYRGVTVRYVSGVGKNLTPFAVCDRDGAELGRFANLARAQTIARRWGSKSRSRGR